MPLLPDPEPEEPREIEIIWDSQHPLISALPGVTMSGFFAWRAYRKHGGR